MGCHVRLVDSLAWCSGHRAGKEIVRKLLGSVRVVNQQSLVGTLHDIPKNGCKGD